ncbi:hypothetical protein OIU76_020745, partial [Salix suchowensis]
MLIFFFPDRMTSDNLEISRHKMKQKLKTHKVRMKLIGHHPIRSYNLEQLPAAVVSKTLRKNRALGMDNLASRILPRVAIRFLLTCLVIPPMDTISAYAAGSLFPLNEMATVPLSMTIT